MDTMKILNPEDEKCGGKKLQFNRFNPIIKSNRC